MGCRLRTGLSANPALAGAAPATRRTASTRPIVVLVLCGAFLIALVVGVIALILSNLRQHAIEQSKQQLLATATVLARQAARDFQSIDLIEANLIEYMETLAIVSDELYARAMVGRGIHLMLKDKISGFPHIGAVMLVGADGRLINSSQAWPTPALNFAGRDFFEALKASPRLSSMLGEPTRDPQTGVWTIYFARKFRGSNGEFLGLVVGTVASQYFEDSYGTLARGTDESTALFRNDGIMLARYPHIDSLIGKSFVRDVAGRDDAAVGPRRGGAARCGGCLRAADGGSPASQRPDQSDGQYDGRRRARRLADRGRVSGRAHHCPRGGDRRHRRRRRAVFPQAKHPAGLHAEQSVARRLHVRRSTGA